MFVNGSGLNDLPKILPTKVPVIWPSIFREDFLEIDQLEKIIACGGHVC
jgi:hypothetical protein